MPRGTGKNQQLILDALAEHGPYYLAALAGGGTPYKYIRAAAVRLFGNDRINLIGDTSGDPKVVVAHPDTTSEKLDREQIAITSRQVAAWYTNIRGNHDQEN